MKTAFPLASLFQGHLYVYNFDFIIPGLPSQTQIVSNLSSYTYLYTHFTDKKIQILDCWVSGLGESNTLTQGKPLAPKFVFNILIPPEVGLLAVLHC